jgi:putative oxygen-independent coproporphyrinogen III oxidase
MKTLYIHIPFCFQKCFYCSFVVVIGQTKKINLYLDCLEKEAQRYKGEPIESIYIGGGTPSLLNENYIKRLFHIIEDNFIFSKKIEITYECNPEELTKEKLGTLKRQGVSRISLGIQTFNEKYLKYLGRNHNAEQARNALKLINDAGFNGISGDLMFSFKNQTLEEVKDDIDMLVAEGVNHVSLYSLTVEERSRFFTKKEKLPNNDMQTSQYTFICDELKHKGFKQYEISNFAKEGKHSLHNLNYWKLGEYIGLGVGAHSYIDQRRYWNVSHFQDYIKKMTEDVSVVEQENILSNQQQLIDAILFGLRINEGIDIDLLEKRFDVTVPTEKKEILEVFIKEGFLVKEKNCLKTTHKGRCVLDELCVRLV